MSKRYCLIAAVVIAAIPPIRAQSAEKLFLFGGSGHSLLLGCLTCSPYEENSVDNKNGPYGNANALTSIWNRHGAYGSRYSATSVCNPYASDPPVILNKDKESYGRLTLNRYGYGGAQNDARFQWLRTAVCGEK